MKQSKNNIYRKIYEQGGFDKLKSINKFGLIGSLIGGLFSGLICGLIFEFNMEETK